VPVVVQGIFDDLNPKTRSLWDYRDGPWDAERNTREFVAAMPEWRDHGLLSLTINLQGGRVHELIRRVQEHSRGRVANSLGRLLVRTSFGAVPPEAVIGIADFILLYGNGLRDPHEVRQLVDRCRMSSAYTGQPIVFNEDDHTDFDRPNNHLLAAISRHGSWGFFDYRRKGEKFGAGYQSMPTNWGINTARKQAFFGLIRQITRGQ
jgi:hypothetical protein